MAAPAREQLFAGLRAIAKRFDLSVLILFGSRSRTDSSIHSDWDFGFLSQESQDLLAIAAEISGVTASDRVDLVDLARAGGLLRYRAARDGVLVYEAAPGLFDGFRIAAARFWYDAEPVLRDGYEEILERLA